MMSPNTALNVPAKSYQMAHQAVDFALSSLTTAEVLPPTAMIWDEDSPSIKPFAFEAYDDSIEMAMRFINQRGDGAKAYAVVWNGYVEVDGHKRDAVIAEVGDRAHQHSLQVAQPYTPGRDGVMVADGELMAIGESDNLLQVLLSTETMDRHLIRPAYVTTHDRIHALTSQAFVRMPVALVCMAANLFDGAESEHVMQGIRRLQELEADRSVSLNHHVFSALVASVADGDLMNVLPSDDLQDMAQIVVDGGRQIKEAVERRLVSAEDAGAYLAAVKSVLDATLAGPQLSDHAEQARRLLHLYEQASAL